NQFDSNSISKNYQVYEDSECNKEICLIIVERVKAAEYALDKMMRRKEENKKYFCKQDYFFAFKRFEINLKNIKDFTIKVSKLKGYRTFFSAKNVKFQYENLTKEYNSCMNDLHFAIVLASKEERKAEARKVDQSLKDIEEEISIIKSQIDKLQSNDINVPKIDAKELINSPFTGDNDIHSSHHPFHKKFYKGFEVACKSIEDSKRHQGELTILEKLSLLPNILCFYGLSYIDNCKVMVSEWAEHRSLKDHYDNYDITWPRKLQIIRDICHAILFLHEVNIFHHDIRCENVLVMRGLDPKLGNFKFAHETNADTTTWQHVPHQRISITKLFEILEALATTYPIPITLNASSGLLPDRTVMSKNKEQATILFKEAADNDIPDAQYR
ncbi:22568_t:CDS:2, partial [Gigaspora margarita]